MELFDGDRLAVPESLEHGTEASLADLARDRQLLRQHRPVGLLFTQLDVSNSSERGTEWVVFGRVPNRGHGHVGSDEGQRQLVALPL